MEEKHLKELETCKENISDEFDKKVINYFIILIICLK